MYQMFLNNRITNQHVGRGRRTNIPLFWISSKDVIDIIRGHGDYLDLIFT